MWCDCHMRDHSPIYRVIHRRSILSFSRLTGRVPLVSTGAPHIRFATGSRHRPALLQTQGAIFGGTPPGDGAS